MSPALVWFLQTALIIGAIVATIYLIRRHKPDGLAAVIVAPVNIVTASATRFADWLRAGTNRLRQHADEHGQKVFTGAAHPLATGLMYVGLAGLWLTVMTFYVLRNATIVLTEHREFMRASRLLDPSFIDPKPLAPLDGPRRGLRTGDAHRSRRHHRARAPRLHRPHPVPAS